MSEQRPHPRQIVRYAFYKAAPSWAALPDEDRAAARKELAEVLLGWRERIPMLRSYSTIGTRGDVDLLLWEAAPDLETIHVLAAEVRATAMGRHLTEPHSFLAMTKRSPYEDRLDPGRRQKLQVKPGRARYLFVYPFVKTRAWYLLPFEQRQAMMDAHIEVGHRYPRVKLNTTYSFGLDDQEFVVAFESDHPEDFLDLVMELREAASSGFTLRDTPIFTCLAGEPDAVLAAC
ncbi:MAG TPA: chlorite dismutase family protein [Actinomycetota bacterium]|jgi:chlorite dismutase